MFLFCPHLSYLLFIGIYYELAKKTDAAIFSLSFHIFIGIFPQNVTFFYLSFTPFLHYFLIPELLNGFSLVRGFLGRTDEIDTLIGECPELSFP